MDTTMLNIGLGRLFDTLDTNSLQAIKQILEATPAAQVAAELINAGVLLDYIHILSDQHQVQAAIVYINEKLSRPNAEQRALLNHLTQRVMRRMAGGNMHENTGGAQVQPEHVLVLGGPGVGKTHFVKRLILELEGMGCSLVSVAFTGVAACNIPGGRTIHSVFNLPISATGNSKLAPLSDEQAYVLRSYMQNRSFLLIDEISMVSPALLGMMHERLCQAMDSIQPFGGMEVIALGDFYQLQPCNPPALFTAIMDIVQGMWNQRALYRQVGAELFKTFKLIELKQQMRAREDQIHSHWVERFRDPTCSNPVDDDFIALLHSRLLSEQDVINDPSWAWAPIAITRNMEKRELDWRQAQAFATAHGVPLVVWNNTITSPLSLANSGNVQLKNLYDQEPGLKSFFVKGGPAYLSKNWRNGGVSRGLANGTSCTMHSLTFRMETPEQQQVAHEMMLHINNAGPGEIVDLGSVTPLSINIEHTVTASEARNWPAGGSLLPPVVDNLNNRGTVIVPVVCDDNDSVYTRRCSNFWAGGSINFKRHSVEPAFAITYHKLQGKTVSKIILDLRKRPGSRAGICNVEFEGMYVGWTRVRKGADIRVIPCGDGENFDHLRKLGPSNNLIAWTSGFGSSDSGWIRGWSRDLALQMLHVLNTSGLRQHGPGLTRSAAGNQVTSGRPAHQRGRQDQQGGNRQPTVQHNVMPTFDLQTVMQLDRQGLQRMT
jgi:hypothetical protein